MRRSDPKHGFSLIELLIVISIIGMLLALMMPSVQSSREAARRTQCANSLRQVGIAFQLHHSTHGHYPTNGWGYLWVGDPDRGFREEQPGGWIYNVLPYIEENDVRDMAQGHEEGSLKKRAATAQMLQTEIRGFNCPTRRAPILAPTNDPFEPWNSETVNDAYRADYAANGGDHGCDPNRTKVISPEGPVSFEHANEDAWREEFQRLQMDCNGIAHPQSVVASQHITDGASKTYLVGEKYIHPDHYLDGKDVGDRRSMLMGANREINRWGAEPPKYDLAATQGAAAFGSAHPAGLNMVFCDGSLRTVSYDIEKSVHRIASNRRDSDLNNK